MSLKCQPSAASQVYPRYRRERTNEEKGVKGARWKCRRKEIGHERQQKYKGRGDEETDTERGMHHRERARKGEKKERKKRRDGGERKSTLTGFLVVKLLRCL